MKLEVSFANEPQREYYYATARNQVFSGGFNNGKTFIACLKSLSLLLTFERYRMIIARETYSNLKKTTMESFFKLCPKEVIQSHNGQDGITEFTNGSKIWWMHLDNMDEHTLKGIEPNSVLVDQAEEAKEKILTILDARVGRWDGAGVPIKLLDRYPDWPLNPKTLRPLAPNYYMLLCNPDTTFHYIYRKYHPQSLERDPDYFYCEGQWDQNLGSYESYIEALKRDPEWVTKYVRGGWGVSESAIHIVDPQSYLTYTPELVEWIKREGNLFRSFDHGDSAPSCCLWVAAIGGVYIFYREYYSGGKVISYHRKAIAELSNTEEYSGSYADPQIFKKTAQKDGGFFSVADEYLSRDIEGDPIAWIRADNNEFATRNRINELLMPSSRFAHPVTKARPAPGIYYIRKSVDYPYGCDNAIKQLSAQRRLLVDTIDGKNVYDDARDESITDHAYDPTRYFVAMHGTSPNKLRKKPVRNSFAYYNAIREKLNRSRPQAASLVN